MGLVSLLNPSTYIQKRRLAKDISEAYRELAGVSRSLVEGDTPNIYRGMFSLRPSNAPCLEENARYHERLVRLPFLLSIIDQTALEEHLGDVRSALEHRELPLEPTYRYRMHKEPALVYTHGRGVYPFFPVPKALRKRSLPF